MLNPNRCRICGKQDWVRFSLVPLLWCYDCIGTARCVPGDHKPVPRWALWQGSKEACIFCWYQVTEGEGEPLDFWISCYLNYISSAPGKAWWNPTKRTRAIVQNHRRGANITGPRINRLAILNRDDWVCQLCREPIDPLIYWPAPMSGVVDHIVPVVRGGTNDPDNLQAAHSTCNGSRGAKGTLPPRDGPGQLTLPLGE